MRIICLFLASLTLINLQVLGADAVQEPARLQGLILLDSPSKLLHEGDPGLAIKGLVVKDIRLLEGADFQHLMETNFGKIIDKDLISGLPRTVIEYYRVKNFPLVDAYFPEQTVSGGVMQLVIAESKLGKIVFEGGNRWTTQDYLRGNLRLAQGQPIDETLLAADLNRINQNRFRSVSVFYKPGANPLETDLVVRTEDRFPVGGTLAIDNTGNPLTGEVRLSAGVEWGEAFGRPDNVLTYRFITDPDVDRLRAHVVTYSLPIRASHSLSLLGSVSDVRGQIPGTPIGQSGSSYQASGRYALSLPTVGVLRHEMSLSAEFRHVENNLEFNFTNVLADATETFHLSAGYTGIVPDAWGSTLAGAELVFSPGNVSGLNDNAAFRRSNPGAAPDPRYFYGHFNIERITRLPFGLTWRAVGAAQIADGNLVPSEQLGLGGSSTVRGYEENQAHGAEGFLISQELRFPSFSPANLLDSTAHDNLQFLGFYDYGQVSNPRPVTFEDPHIIMESAGIGFRYGVSRYLTVRFDYGWQLRQLRGSRENSRGHIAAQFNF